VLTVARDGVGVRATSRTGWSWRGSTFAIDGDGARVKLVVRGRDTRTRAFSGAIEVTNTGPVLQIVAEMPIEQLVASAVSAELANVQDAAALEAAAIVLRGYLVTRTAHRAQGFDLCDSTHCVHSQGAPNPDDPHDRAAIDAAAATSGLVLEYRSRVMPGYVTSVCGGRTATPRDVWGARSDDGYVAVRCTLCAASKYYRWQRVLPATAVAEVLHDLLGDRLRSDLDVRVVAERGGIAADVSIRGSEREVEVTGDAFRLAIERRLGWDTIPSNRFTIERRRGDFVVSGSGYGHCVGLCLEGAVTLARMGTDSRAIVRRYFPMAKIERLPESAP
jgi:stage II sporulation protein D